MATAPRPGARREQAAMSDLKIVVDGVETLIKPRQFGPRDEVVVRHATRQPDPKGWGVEMSLQGLLNQMGDVHTVGADTICTLWWFGRYKNGEQISLAECIAAWPAYDEVQDRVDIYQVDDDVEDLRPEASGPSS
jgi:hypothetical protein